MTYLLSKVILFHQIFKSYTGNYSLGAFMDDLHPG